MEKKIYQLNKELWPLGLQEIPEPPKQLNIIGSPPPKENINICIVGSRKNTEYGKKVCEELIKGLKGYPFSIISGLALGIDGIAHQAAIDAELYTAAVIGSGLNQIYPKSHMKLAGDILNSGGAIISEYANDDKASKYTFPERNRIMAGMSHAVLVIEATDRSGTLITSRLATEYNRDVLAVPGPVDSDGSFGPHMLIKLGAVPITSSEDILEYFSPPKLAKIKYI
ncbi:MAG: DNA processing protein [Candidatus Paceibacteria bacterium]|jgi:DNA processing protein